MADPKNGKFPFKPKLKERGGGWMIMYALFRRGGMLLHLTKKLDPFHFDGKERIRPRSIKSIGKCVVIEIVLRWPCVNKTHTFSLLPTHKCVCAAVVVVVPAVGCWCAWNILCEERAPPLSLFIPFGVCIRRQEEEIFS